MEDSRSARAALGVELARSAASAAGRDPDALELTRWASTELTQDGVEARARQGVTRVVVGATGPRLLTFNEHAHLDGDTPTYR